MTPFQEWTVNGMLENSYALCHDAVGRTSPGLAWCLHRLRGAQRDRAASVVAMGAALRGLVASADAGDLSREDARAALAFWRQWFADGCWDEVDDVIAPAVRYTMLAAEVPTRLFIELVDALNAELDRPRYLELSDLATHCYGVSSTICLALCHVLELDDEETCARAAELGVALRLTDIIRGVGRDLAHDRVYLPRSLMARHRVTEGHLRARVITRGYANLIEELSSVAIAYFDSARAGLPALSADERRAVAPLIAVHRDSLRAVRKHSYDNITVEPRVQLPRKLFLGAGALLHPRAHRGAVPDGLPDGMHLISSAGSRPGAESLA